jgi:hypothetical protein
VNSTLTGTNASLLVANGPKCLTSIDERFIQSATVSGAI